MYALMIVTLLAASFLLLSNQGTTANPMVDPSPFKDGYAAYSASHGRDLANFMGGVQRLISVYDHDPANPGGADLEIAAQLAANNNPAALRWTISWNSVPGVSTGIADFLGASAYAGGLGQTRADLYPPGYAPSGPWNVTLIEQTDAVGAGTGRIGALIAWADPADANMPQLDAGAFLGGFSNAMGNTANAGINDGGTLVARGAYSAGVAFPGGVYTTINNIPATIPNGAWVYIQCRLADDPLSADGFCD